ncbi:MAG: alpha/beta fold hydrolase [Actinomycetes bacterium]
MTVIGRSRQLGIFCTNHTFSVPLDHDDPTGPQIQVFAREIVGADMFTASGRFKEELPWLVFLQGGPGGRAGRPVGRADWLDRALRSYRVVLLDQRGTGLSTPATRHTLAGLGSPADQAAYLQHFRADAIVRDAELVRRDLVGPTEPWSALGQSYGGFCAMTYLSVAPEGLREVFVTGGLPPLSGHPDQVYRATYRRVLDKNAAYFDRYPEDRDRLGQIVAHLRENDVRLPGGDRLSVPRFQMMGMSLGDSRAFHQLHYTLEDAFLNGGPGSALSDIFLRAVDSRVSFAENPLYAVLHESIYCQHEASRWSAERTRSEFAQFDPGADRVMFTGEMIYPMVFDEDPALVPLRDVAHVLAAKDDWPALYDESRLAANKVPVAAAIYHDDMYVDYGLSLQTAKSVNNLRYWVTNEHEHDGLRTSPGVLDRLIKMVRGEV